MGVQEAAWELGSGVRVEGNPPWGGRDGVVCVVERSTDGPHAYHDFELQPESAEARAVALLKAAAVARGERGLTAALNRVTAALGSPESELPERMKQEMRNALHMADDAPWGLLVDTASRLRGELDEACSAIGALEAMYEMVEADLADARDALSGKTQHDAAAEVVAPLREALKSHEPGDRGWCEDVDGWPPSEVVSVAAGQLAHRPAKPTREPMTHHSLASIEQNGVVVGDRLSMGSSVVLRHVATAAGRALSASGPHGNILAGGDAVGFAVVESVEPPDAD